MNIVHVTRSFSFANWGDTETVIWNSVKHMKRNGHEPSIICTAAMSRPGKDSCEGISIERFHHFYPHLLLSRDKKALLDRKGGNPVSPDLYRHLLSCTDADLFHCHTGGRLADTVCRAAEEMGKPWIITLYPQKYADYRDKSKVKSLGYTFNLGRLFDAIRGENDYMAKSSAILTSSYSEFDECSSRYRDKIVRYIPNGVSAGVFEGCRKKRKEFRDRYNISDNSVALLTVSGIEPVSNQNLLIELAVELIKAGEDIHLIIVGTDISGKYLRKLENMMSDYSMKEKVTIITEFEPYSRLLVSAYGASDIFILPALRDVTGIVVLEAWASGLPVLVSDKSGLNRLVENRETGLFFNPDSLNDLVDKYYLIKEDNDLGYRLGNTGNNKVIENFCWQKITTGILGVYEELLSSG